MIKGSLIFIKHLILFPLYIPAYIVIGICTLFMLLLKELDEIGRDSWKEEKAGTYDYRQNNGLGTRKIYRV